MKINANFFLRNIISLGEKYTVDVVETNDGKVISMRSDGTHFTVMGASFLMEELEKATVS